MARITQEEVERFNKFIINSGDCRLWTGYCDRDGYGKFFFRKRQRSAHRVAYYISHGDIPKGLVVDHVCKNRNCVNFQHLRTVTAIENTMQNSASLGAINKAKTHCKNGHPFDRKYGKQRYCSICEAAKGRRLRKKWSSEDTVGC